VTVKEVRVEKKIGNHVLSFETGFLAKQAAGATVVRYGETVVLTAVTTAAPRPGIDFFPLTVDYRERISAAGKFPGGFIKREGRPSTKETLSSRLIDRPLRPLFPDWFRNEVQVQSIVLASDRQNDPDVLAVNGASAALGVSSLPFEGPVAAVRLGLLDGQYIPFPTQDELEHSDLDLVIAGTAGSITMIEGFARELPEEQMALAIMEAHRIVQEICALQTELAEKVGVVKSQEPAPTPNPFLEPVKAKFFAPLKVAKRTEGKQARADAVRAVKEAAKAELLPADADATTVAAFDSAFSSQTEAAVRDLILDGTRPDGRDGKTLRPLFSKVDVLPRVHGSAIFQRGETQALVVVTLGTGHDEQRVDGLMDEYSKKFMLDYNFPSFSVGECRPIRGPGRREIGHGALAERSVKPILPDPDQFPYTIRVVSEILESNGSSSMAAVCGATLALMAAGVPLRAPVAGISIGLVKESDDRWMLLTDIIGDEDHFGDMDFKIAGTHKGVTGIQLDLKIKGISEAIVRATLAQAREARMEILKSMLAAIIRPRDEISHFAPRLEKTKIDPEKIGALIGPGGKTIRAIQEATGTKIDVDDDGTVTIASDSAERAREALSRVEAVTGSIQVGRIYEGRVTSIKDFGAFVEILPGKDGLCHISELSDEYVRSVSDICKVGDPMKVKVIAVDDQDRVKLSRRQAMAPPPEPAPAADPAPAASE